MIFKHFSDCKTYKEKIDLLEEEEKQVLSYLSDHIDSFKYIIEGSGVVRQVSQDIKYIIRAIKIAQKNRREI